MGRCQKKTSKRSNRYGHNNKKIRRKKHIHNIKRQPYSVYINGERVKKLDKDFTIIEYTPLDKKYNVRIHVNDKKEILEYYFDIIAENKIKDGIPFYNDLYLDVVYFQPAATKEGTYIQLVDCNELEEALKENIIDKEQFDMAYIEAEKLMKEKLVCKQRTRRLLENKKATKRKLKNYQLKNRGYNSQFQKQKALKQQKNRKFLEEK